MITNPKSLHGLAVALLLASAQVTTAIAAAEPVVISTISGERFIGTPGADELGYVTLVSQTLGEIRIPRSSIHTQTPVPAEAHAPAPAPKVVAAVKPPAAPKEGFIQSRLDIPGQFDASLGLGLMAQSGAFEQTTLSYSANVRWTVDANTLQSSLSAHRQSVNGKVVDDALQWDLQLQHNLSPKRFWMAASFYRQDTAMAIDREEVFFLGAGYNLVKTKVAEMVTVIGPSYIWQEYLAPGSPSLGDPALVLYQSLNYALLPRMKFSSSVLIAQSLDDQEKLLARLILSVDFSLTENLSLGTSYFWMRDSLPRFGSSKHQGALTTQLKLKL